MNIPPRAIHQKGLKPAVSKPVRNAAKDTDCKLAIPGVCCGQPSRTVGNHMRHFAIAGAAQKPDDIFILDACDCCHRAFDDRSSWDKVGLTWEMVLRAFMFSLRSRRNAGLINLKGEK